ncbi:MAG: hypothetical protein EOP11_16810 [Proteobacteria bacterium]|nr:MAG: hypothetical protein EOP11_16810 [Pseudomonadota bacterium]
MMRRRRKKEPLPLLDLAVLALVATFFCYSGYTFWNGKPRPPMAAQNAPTIPTRDIASVSPAPLAPELSTQTVNIDCLGSSTLKPLRTQANLLRVQGRLCGRAKKISGKNTSTEEDLQIFLRGDKFTSHYFPLAKGLNKIVLEDSAGRGAKIQSLDITRDIR